MKLRDYQDDTQTAVFKEWEAVTSTIAVLPTGGGKTIVFASIIQKMQPKRAMVLAHREELVWQARDKITKVTGLECGIEMADHYVNNSLFGEMPVIISTVQTQNSNNGDRKRMGRFNPKDFGVLILDECHHATADSYRSIINYYKTNNPDIKILGVTATPDRADEEAMGQVFETVAIDIEILDLIHRGWLVHVDQQFATVSGLDFSEMRTTAGDLNGADLAEVMESEAMIMGVIQPTLEAMFRLPALSLNSVKVEKWGEHLGALGVTPRRSIAFASSVNHAKLLCNIFNRVLDRLAGWVCGFTPKDERQVLLSHFKEGKIQIICNCGVLTEGFDDPGVEVIVMARPTKSRSLYAQMTGRATRPLPGLVDGLDTPEARVAAIAASAKPSCLVLDFVGNSGRHKLMTSANILGGKVSDEAVERAIIKAKKEGNAVRMDAALDEEEEKIRVEAEERRRAEEARKMRLVGKSIYNVRSVNPFDLFQIAPVRERGWDQGKILSERQKAVLLKNGINPSEMPYGQAKQVLNEYFRRIDEKLATVKQLSVLRRYGYTDRNMKFDTARELLDRLSKNGWRKTTMAAPANPQPEEETSPF